MKNVCTKLAWHLHSLNNYTALLHGVSAQSYEIKIPASISAGASTVSTFYKTENITYMHKILLFYTPTTNKNDIKFSHVMCFYLIEFSI